MNSKKTKKLNIRKENLFNFIFTNVGLKNTDPTGDPTTISIMTGVTHANLGAV